MLSAHSTLQSFAYSMRFCQHHSACAQQRVQLGQGLPRHTTTYSRECSAWLRSRSALCQLSVQQHSHRRCHRLSSRGAQAQAWGRAPCTPRCRSRHCRCRWPESESHRLATHSIYSRQRAQSRHARINDSVPTSTTALLWTQGRSLHKISVAQSTPQGEPETLQAEARKHAGWTCAGCWVATAARRLSASASASAWRSVSPTAQAPTSQFRCARA